MKRRKIYHNSLIEQRNKRNSRALVCIEQPEEDDYIEGEYNPIVYYWVLGYIILGMVAVLYKQLIA